jgi:ribose transport system ATP-binding protein
MEDPGVTTADGRSQTETALLDCRGIGKRFGGTMALDDVDFTLARGEVHGVVGCNGAGKSTLMKILAGALPDHDGSVLLDGQAVALASPLAALRHGIAMVYQELSGIGQLSVAENLFLGRQPTARFGRIDWTRMFREAERYLAEMEIPIDVRRRLDSYPLVVRQMVEIARGLHSGARVLILDEPTSALSPPETRRLFTLVRQLRERGVAIIFISHFIDDVLEICDRVTILRDGRRLETSSAKSLDKSYVIRTMLGQSADSQTAAEPARVSNRQSDEAATNREPLLVVERLTLSGLFDDVSLTVAPGEFVGLYGFVGAGHQELVHAIAGALRPESGRVLIGGELLQPTTHEAIRRGVVLVAADRARTLVRSAPIYQNVTLTHLRSAVGNWLTSRRELAITQPMLERVTCKPPRPRLPVGQLSGGNQQKVVLAKWLLGPIRLLALEEPTRGMDVGAKAEVMRIVRDLQRQGAAVILASTEPELLLDHADRILCFRRGRITQELSANTADQSALLRSA